MPLSKTLRTRFSTRLARGAILATVLSACSGARPPLLEDAAPTTRQPDALDLTWIRERYGPVATRIIDATRAGHDGMRKLEQLCDGIGHRLSGSAGLEKAVAWAAETMRRDGLENVRTQKVMVPRWVRGTESLEMIEPLRMPLSMLGLGGSVATPPEGITAEVVSVGSQDELTALGDKVRGKIVLFDVPMPTSDAEKGAGYGPAVRYRGMGARWASQFGAVAALSRSATTRSLRTPHTGALNYFDASNRIPGASVATEDAMMLTRLLKSGQTVRVTLKMEARTDDQPAESANVIGELRGSTAPDEIVVIGGHLDSWDVGQGAHDDGGGCVMAMEAVNVLTKLGLRPRRTIRVVLFTNEENGIAGGRAYAKEFAAELPGHVAAIEADSGTFRPRGYGVSCYSAEGQKTGPKILSNILDLLAPIGPLEAAPSGGGADIGPMRDAGVPLLGLNVDMTHYFDYHHTHADTLDKIDPRDLTDCIASMAVLSYVLADMPERIDGGHGANEAKRGDASRPTTRPAATQPSP